MEHFNRKYWYNFYVNSLLKVKDYDFIKVDDNTYKKFNGDKDIYFYLENKRYVPYSFTFHLNNIWFPRFKYKEQIILR